MADIKTVKIGGTSYNIEDANAVSGVTYNSPTRVVTITKRNGTTSTFTIKSENASDFNHWVGTKAQYNAIQELDPETIYFTTDEGGEDYLDEETLRTILLAYALGTALNTHVSNTSNPHEVTLAQAGAISPNTLNNHINNTSNPHQVTLAQLSGASLGDLNNHINNHNNPHNVTAAQLNLYTMTEIDTRTIDAADEYTHTIFGSEVPASTIGKTNDFYYISNPPNRNLALGTAQSKTCVQKESQTYFTPIGLWSVSDYGRTILLNDNNTDDFIISFDWVATNATIDTTLDVRLKYTSSSYSDTNATVISITGNEVSTGDCSGHFVKHFKPSVAQRNYGKAFLLLTGETDTSVSFVLSNFKFEYGTEATSWIPAPEDSE